MDFSTLKPGQLKTVTTLDRPLFVAAGAGSGKTFTLTQRVVWALTPGSGEDGAPYLDDLGQALIITFTNAAAGEIKERVRSALRAEGLEQAALDVDSAWISTIHGMCARILRDHALDLGIDPDFKMVPDIRADEMLEDATEGALRDFADDPELDRLFERHPSRGGTASGADSSTSAAGMARTLANAALGAPDGFDSLAWVGEGFDATSIVTALMGSYERLLGTDSGKHPEEAEKIAGFVAAIDSWLCSTAPDARDAALSALLGTLGKPDGRLWRGGEQKEAWAEAKRAWAEASCGAALAVERELRVPLLRLAKRIVERYDQAKARYGGLDNDDLLRKTFEAFESHPEIAAEYADRFRLVMVDEFQDTSEQQVKMVKMLSGPDACHLASVGDAQQSIYRFRGADVSVFLRRGSETPAELKPTMADNFRSHDDILRFVARVCGAPGMIPDFMDLAAGRDESKVAYAASGEPRVYLEVTCDQKSGNTSAGADARAAVAARQVADRLAHLACDCGVPAGDMALLLGRMKNTAVFASALRERGIDCVVTGGSTFSSAPEVQTVSALLDALADPHDTKCLFMVLSSPMFSLDANDLVLLGTRRQDAIDAPTKRPIENGMVSRELMGDVEPGPRLRQAFDVMNRAWARMGRMPVADVLLAAARESGWLARLEADGPAGQAMAANVLAAVRHVRELAADDTLGVAGAAYEFGHWLRVAKAAPAALVGGEGNAVSIMTVHASKGLEFPVVAVAECLEDPSDRSAGCLAVNDGDRVLVSLRGTDMPEFKPLQTELEKAGELPTDPSECRDLLDWRIYLERRNHDEELAEKVRLLYVALTRAREALVLSVPMTVGKTSVTPRLASLVSDAVFGEGELPPTGASTVAFGGSLPAVVRRSTLTTFKDKKNKKVVKIDADGMLDLAGFSSDPDEEPAPPTAAPFDLYVQADPALMPARLARARTGVYSYSSVHAAANGAPVLLELPATTSFSAVVGDLGESGDTEALRAPEHSDDPDDELPSATAMGSAFHELAQLMAETGERPSDERVAAVAGSWGCSRGQRARLDAALARWRDSDIRREALSHELAIPEAPFFCERPGECGRFVEGAIDLLCLDRGSDEALVIDYKTGDADRDADSLRRVHGLQAAMYADVLLGRGYSHVECAFVCVERETPEGQPVVVRYGFGEAAGTEERVDG